MVKTFEIAGLKVEPGTKKRGYLRAGPYFYHNRADIRRYTLIPFTVINGLKDGPTLVQTAGCHPAEYAGIDATIKLTKEINPEELSGTFIGIPCMNIPGFWERTYINPIDGKNLQGLFPGNPEGSLSEQIAHVVFNEIVKKANYLIDCHGGDVHESTCWQIIYYNTGGNEIEITSEAMARATSLKYVWYIGIHNGALGMEAVKKGIPTINYELNTGDRLLPEEVSAIFDGTKNVMMHLNMLKGKSKKTINQPGTTEDQEQDIWVSSKAVYFTKNGLYHTSLKPGDPVKEGQILGTVEDLWGDTIETIHSPASGRILSFVHNPLVIAGDSCIRVMVKGQKDVAGV